MGRGISVPTTWHMGWDISDRGRAGAKAQTVGTKLMGYFGGEPVPYGTDDRGRAGAKALTVGTKLMGYFGGEPVQLVIYPAPQIEGFQYEGLYSHQGITHFQSRIQSNHSLLSLVSS